MSDTPEEISIDLSLATSVQLRDELAKRFPDGRVIVGGIRSKKNMPLVQSYKSPDMLSSTAIGLLEMFKAELVAGYVDAPSVDPDGRPQLKDDDDE